MCYSWLMYNFHQFLNHWQNGYLRFGLSCPIDLCPCRARQNNGHTVNEAQSSARVTSVNRLPGSSGGGDQANPTNTEFSSRHTELVLSWGWGGSEGGGGKTRQDKTLFTLGPLLNGVGGIYTKYLSKTRDNNGCRICYCFSGSRRLPIISP